MSAADEPATGTAQIRSPQHSAAVNDSRTVDVFHDRSFWGLTVSQFLGAFNDNLFKQLVLLLCLDVAHAQAAVESTPGPGAAVADVADKWQPVALAMFALPWVLFSGLAGFLSDRMSKRRGIVLFKSLEIAVMALGLAAFLTGRIEPLLGVVFLMSMQSAFFGPSKYGILPELFHPRTLPRINGVFQMTTFLAIIFGFAAAGLLKDAIPGQAGLAVASLLSIGLAIAGTIAAMQIRDVPAAHPTLSPNWSSLVMDRDAVRLLRSNGFLLGVLLVQSLFFFTASIAQPAVNAFGRSLGINDTRTSVLQMCIGLGIAAGCVTSGRLSLGQVRFGLVRAGATGMTASLICLTVLGSISPIDRVDTIEWLSRFSLAALGFGAGLFVVPLQVVLQSAPPEDLKGRMMGVVNLTSWIGILIAAGCYGAFEAFRVAINSATSIGLRPASVFAVLGTVLGLVALLYRPADRVLE